MPELPEVETVVRDLRPELVGRRFGTVVAGAKALRQPWQRSWSTRLNNQQILAVRRRGKWIAIDLESGVLVVHLGMTGQLTTGPQGRPFESHTHLRASLDSGAELRFRDVRRFGSVSLFPSVADAEAFLTERLGPEPWDLTPAAWRTALARTIRALKAVLLDQTVVAGVGNIYADEALYRSRLPPTLRGCETTPGQADRLRRAVATILQSAIERRGSTIRDYVGGSGLRGGYQSEFRVYGRTGQPCRRCRSPIAHTRIAGRSSHYCPNCQR